MGIFNLSDWLSNITDPGVHWPQLKGYRARPLFYLDLPHFSRCVHTGPLVPLALLMVAERRNKSKKSK